MSAEGSQSSETKFPVRPLPDWSRFPGAPLVMEGLSQLKRGEVSQEGLAVLLAKSRLLGLRVPLIYEGPEIARPEEELYAKLCLLYGDDAHAKFNAIRREIVSFAEAVETAVAPQ